MGKTLLYLFVLSLVVFLGMGALNNLNLLTVLEAILDAILVAIVIMVAYTWMDHVSVLTVLLCSLYRYDSIVFLYELHILLGLAMRSHLI